MGSVVNMIRFHYSFFKSVPVILAIGAVILFAIVLGALFFSQRAGDESTDAVAANRLNLRILRLLSSIQDAETGQRGFLLTGDERYLGPFTRSVSTLPSEMAAVSPLLAQLDLPQASIDQLKDLMAKKLSELQRTVDLQRAGDTAGALAVVKSNEGIRQMDEIRDIIGQLQQSGIQNSAVHINALRSTTTWLSTIIAISAALLVVLAGGAMKLIYDHTRQIEQAQNELSHINENLEATVAARTESLQRANSELQTYAYIVSHDLRAPLVNIMGFTEELDRASGVFRSYLSRTDANPADPDAKLAIEAVETDIPEALGFIRSSMRRMDNLINQILVMARAGNRELRRERIKLGDLVEEMLATLRHRLDEDDIAVDMADNLPDVQSDRLALQQIVGNLLDNAIKYMDREKAGRIEIRGWRHGMSVTLEISDNGRGIADGDRERIFELFRRSGRQDRPGDGVGLAHVRALTRRLGGDVRVQSTFGEGTTFQVTVAADLEKMKKEEAGA
jgi:signal transduction histidine kinase